MHGGTHIHSISMAGTNLDEVTVVVDPFSSKKPDLFDGAEYQRDTV